MWNGMGEFPEEHKPLYMKSANNNEKETMDVNSIASDDICS